ncbi:hypothetical protein [Candidatus Laterigemmans baculatus]|uniref:hypothetical protein n=1 Tax=Candidatus Laterigemmans baculatus TaxID=2770505 RepID=UPI0013DBD125|nr:hypothetical protein [Candidatus Laterigemmans baculatus]
MVYLLLGFLIVMVAALISFLVISVSLQEANDPVECPPEDLSEFEKRHVHRADILRRPRV